MNGVPFPVGPCVLVLIALASVWDLHARRIPNGLVGLGMVVAIAVHCWLQGALQGLMFVLGGCLIGGGLLLPGYALRLLGAGDVKLMAAIGAFCGAYLAFDIFLGTAVISGVWSLATLIVRKQASRGIHAAASIVMSLGIGPQSSATDKNGENDKVAAHSSSTLPYGVAIALGTVFVLFANV